MHAGYIIRYVVYLRIKFSYYYNYAVYVVKIIKRLASIFVKTRLYHIFCGHKNNT